MWTTSCLYAKRKRESPIFIISEVMEHYQLIIKILSLESDSNDELKNIIILIGCFSVGWYLILMYYKRYYFILY